MRLPKAATPRAPAATGLHTGQSPKKTSAIHPRMPKPKMTSRFSLTFLAAKMQKTTMTRMPRTNFVSSVHYDDDAPSLPESPAPPEPGPPAPGQCAGAVGPQPSSKDPSPWDWPVVQACMSQRSISELVASKRFCAFSVKRTSRKSPAGKGAVHAMPPVVMLSIKTQPWAAELGHKEPEVTAAPHLPS